MAEKIKSRVFKLKKEAVDWAKKQKKAYGPGSGVDWETNRSKNPDMPWEAVLYKGKE